MLTAINTLQARLAKPFSKRTLVRMVSPLARRSMPAYLGFITLLAVCGYILLFLFPLLALDLIFDLGNAFRAAETIMDWLWFVVQIMAIVLAMALSYPLLVLRFPQPQGIELSPENAPKLFALIEELREEYKQPLIDRVIIKADFAIQAIKTPRFAIPVLSNNTLALGLSAIQCLPPEHFKSMLARRIGQFSAAHNRFYSWLHFLPGMWLQYRDAFRKQPHLLAKPLYVLFAIYAPLFQALSFFATRHAELDADRYALDVTNDNDLSEIFSQQIITENFLNQKFWPKLYQLSRRSNGKPTHLPYANMVKVLRNGLNREDMQNWIKLAMQTVSDFDNVTPPLSQRLENIGHDKPASPRPLHETAAEYYIDLMMLQKIINKFDQYWLKQLQRSR